MLRKAAFTKSTPLAGHTPGAIVADALYRLDEAATRLGWGHDAIRDARRQGLQVHRFGRRNFVLGSDLFLLITSQPDAPATAATRRRPAASAKPRPR